MKKSSKIYLIIAVVIMVVFFCLKTIVLFEVIPSQQWTRITEYSCLLLFSIFFYLISKGFISKNKNTEVEHNQLQDFIDNAALISKADEKGKITYVNKKFTEVSGWSLDEVLGKDHSIVNSGYHPKKMWTEMYKTTITDKKIWNNIVTNKAKDGHLYHVDTYIKANFNKENKLTGFMSIRQDVTDIIQSNMEIEKKNVYLEHAAKILRHDMHSGINTYIPRGVTSLERRLKPEDVESLKIQAPLKMIKEGLKHTQKVYKGVYEFTNLVKKDTVLTKTKCDLKEILANYLSSTSYSSQVLIRELINLDVNEPLFCTAIDNLIRNGLRYNDSDNKIVEIFMEEDELIVQDNGRGMTQKELEYLSKPYTRKEGQKETGTGLGLNICLAILEEHGFSVTCEKNKIGTKMKIKLNYQ